MPSSPGSRPETMQLQAGTVIGGSTLRSRPQAPRATSPARFGRSSSQRSKTSDGSAQSRPITATVGGEAMDLCLSAGAALHKARRPEWSPDGADLVARGMLAAQALADEPLDAPAR